MKDFYEDIGPLSGVKLNQIDYTLRPDPWAIERKIKAPFLEKRKITQPLRVEEEHTVEPVFNEMATFLNLIPRLQMFEERAAKNLRSRVAVDIEVAKKEYEKVQKLYEVL